MNKEHVEELIKVMKNAKKAGAKLDMTYWQNTDCLKSSIKEMVDCGTTACMGGFLAVSPAWKKIDGFVSTNSGAPAINVEGLGTLHGTVAIAHYLNINLGTASKLAYVGPPINRVYSKPKKQVTFDDVIKVLQRLRDTGSIYEDSGE